MTANTAQRVATVDDLAQAIRCVDGRHDLGAGALAEALWPHYAALLLQVAELEKDRDGWKRAYDCDVPRLNAKLAEQAAEIERWRKSFDGHVYVPNDDYADVCEKARKLPAAERAREECVGLLSQFSGYFRDYRYDVIYHDGTGRVSLMEKTAAFLAANGGSNG